MICLKCKKNETSILKTFYESLTNTVKRQRTCICGNIFVTYEIDKSELKSKSARILKSSHQLKKKRKPTTKEEWLDFKVFLYAFMRIRAIISSSVSAVDKFDKKFKYKFSEETFLGPTKFPNKKSFFSVFSRKNKDYSDVKIERVKQTIKSCVKTKTYWKNKKKLFKNIIIPELEDKRAISDEINQYNRSITSNIRNEKYDTPDFFNNSKYFNEMIDLYGDGLTKEQLKILKKNIFSSRYWNWYTEVR